MKREKEAWRGGEALIVVVAPDGYGMLWAYSLDPRYLALPSTSSKAPF